MPCTSTAPNTGCVEYVCCVPTAPIAAALDADQVAQLGDGAIAYRSRNGFGEEAVLVEVEGVHLVQGRIDETKGLYWVVTRRVSPPVATSLGMRPINGRSRVELALMLAGEIRAWA